MLLIHKLNTHCDPHDGFIKHTPWLSITAKLNTESNILLNLFINDPEISVSIITQISDTDRQMKIVTDVL